MSSSGLLPLQPGENTQQIIATFLVMQGVEIDLSLRTMMPGHMPLVLAEAIRLALLIFFPVSTHYLPTLL